ncbi:MAG: hypothetical protein CSA33_08055 [Desulfobulbus propionicus]|nr:MAG: hypothetical protein CSA33_08055 [Desulfobulbus propionicus]
MFIHKQNSPLEVTRLVRRLFLAGRLQIHALHRDPCKLFLRNPVSNQYINSFVSACPAEWKQQESQHA